MPFSPSTVLFRRRYSMIGNSLSVCVSRSTVRHASSSSSKNSNSSNNNNNEKPVEKVLGNDKRHDSNAHADSSASSPSAASSAGFKGWKRFDLPRDKNAAPARTDASPSSAATLPSAEVAFAHTVVDQRRDRDEARRREASARLTDMFIESDRHVKWMQEQYQTAEHSQHYEEGLSSLRRVVPQSQTQLQGLFPEDDGRAHETADAPTTATAMTRGNVPKTRNYAYDEDEDGALSSPAHAASALAPLTPTDVLEQELLDDNFLYYPPAVSVHADDATKTAANEPFPEPARERYVPGQQIVPPGFTRYRVDVQYQGSDFDGWYKSVQRTRRSSTLSTTSERGSRGDAAAEGTSRYFARSVLEEALAVALDVAAVSVVAAVIPETGVSVRRLTCHVDVPSEIELQPRTILQRATLWLHQRHQPLAVLSCHPCKNQDFHARHSGVRRVYCYRILNRIAPPLFDAGLQWHVDRYLDVARMQRMARVMEGTHDYGYFADPKMANALRRAAAHTGGGGQVVSSAYSPEHEPLLSHGLPRGQAPAAPKVAIDRGLSQLERAAALPTFNEYGQRVVTYQAKPREYFKAQTNLPTVRTIDKIDVVRQEDEVLIWFVGQSFLRHQIRNMVSVLKAGGHGLWDDQELQHAFQSGFEVSRKKFARERLPPAPVHGLTLWDVEYPPQHASDFVSYVDAGPYEPHDVSAQH